MTDLQRTPLYDLHVELGGKMVPFAGYEMPVQFPMGVMDEHKHTRAHAGLFDVSHMGQVILRGKDYESTALALESLVPVSIAGLSQGRQRYGMLLNPEGGIVDDLMLANRGDHLFVVVNASRRGEDLELMREALPSSVAIEEITDRALLALQGPKAEAVLSALAPQAADMRFMDVAVLEIEGVEVWVSRSGYTGEDGYELSVPSDHAEAFARKLLAHEDVAPIGLGARDSLRLEGGMCLYGNDIDEATTPVEAALSWAIQKIRRRGGAREGGFPGAARVLAQFESGAERVRVGLLPQTRAPMRAGVELYDTETGGEPIGTITSGGFGPTLGAPVAMGYVPRALAEPGSTVYGELRGKRLPVKVSALPFVAANFKR